MTVAVHPLAVSEFLALPTTGRGFAFPMTGGSFALPMTDGILDLSLLALFLLAAGAMILSPGPDSIYVLTQGLSDGRRIGLISAAGISVGVLVHTLAAAVGLSAVFRASETAFGTVTLVGAGYLVYLGVRTIRRDALVGSLSDALVGDLSDATSKPTREPADARIDPLVPFRDALAINVLNPQVAVFFLAFLPQFVDGSSFVTLQLSILGALYALLTMAYLTLVAVAASYVRTTLTHRSTLALGVQWTAGIVLIGLGVWVALDSFGG